MLLKDNRTFTAQLAGRTAGVLLASGGLSGLALALAVPAGGRDGLLIVGPLAALVGLGAWLLPWGRWSPRASLVLIPIAFVLIALGNHLAGAEPFRYAVAFVVAFCWIGFAHPRGMAFAFAPLMAIAYIVPLLTTNSATPHSLGSLLFVLPVSVAAGELTAWVVARLRQSEADLQRMAGEARFRSLVQNGSDVIVIVDTEYRISYETPSVERVLGYLPGVLLGANVLETVHPDDEVVLRAAFERVIDVPSRQHNLEFRVRHADGSWRPVQASVMNLLDDEHVEGLVVSFRDISERRELEYQLRHQAFHDSLTGLANRALFTDRLEHALARQGRARSSLAVMFIDLDDFKAVNDTLGHETGDDVLRTVAERIKDCLRPADTAARFGGDEFSVLLEDTSADEALAVAGRILEALGAPHRVRGREMTLYASVGVVATRTARQTASEILRNADIAMYSAKESGKRRVALFRSTMQRAVARRLQTKAELETAVERGDFVLRYQPVVELETRKICGAEALLRWSHPRRGLVLPGDFMEVAEESGLVVPIGRWALHEAVRQARVWFDATDGGRPLDTGVNVSVKQLHDAAFVDDVRSALEGSKLPANQLTLEITESVVMLDTDVTIKVLAALKQLGVRLVIDDFGTGYSSLNYLRRFPIDGIKIDRSFIAGLDQRDAAAVVSSIISLSRELGLETVVEGIEQAEQLHRITALGAKIGQGYFFAEPLSAELIGELIRQGRSTALLDPGLELAGDRRRHVIHPRKEAALSDVGDVPRTPAA
jgi:diguanylate cyclase (GGDEF)-like protein/PAS domain S-box-containing protein